MSTTGVGFRHRLKRRHFEDEAEYMHENKRHLSEKMAQELGVLRLDDHGTAHATPVPVTGIGSPQSPQTYSSSPPLTSYTPPPSPFNPSTSPTTYSFGQRFTPQSFQQHLQQIHQIQHPIQQLQLQQQLQQHQLLQQRQLQQPSSPPLTPIVYEQPKPDPNKALTVYQPFQFSMNDAKLEDKEDEEEEEKEEKEENEKLPQYTVHLPLTRLEPLLPIPQEDLSRALILYSAPSEVIQESLFKDSLKKNRKASKENEAITEEMDDIEGSPILLGNGMLYEGATQTPSPSFASGYGTPRNHEFTNFTNHPTGFTNLPSDFADRFYQDAAFSNAGSAGDDSMMD